MTLVADFTELLAEFETPITVTRNDKPLIIDGVARPAVPSTVKPLAVIQQADGEDLKMLPEGTRLDSVVRIWSDIQLLPGDDPSGRLADRFEYRGDLYQIMKSDDRKDHGNYFRSLAVRVGQ